jgi:uncharacterized membrane protein HdeD (DUF308 family)
MLNRKHKDLKYFARTLSIVVGLVMIWRGIWHVLDYIEIKYFNGELFWTGLFGILLGTLLLYLPDQDLKEIEKL